MSATQKYRKFQHIDSMLTGYRQVFRKGSDGFVFRISLPVHRFVSEEVFETAADAAFQADLFKLLLVRRYRLTGKTMWPSLPAEDFSQQLREVGIDRSNNTDLFAALSASCKDFLLDGGHELLTKHCSDQATMCKEIS